jgi:hypothetical protein
MWDAERRITAISLEVFFAPFLVSVVTHRNLCAVKSEKKALAGSTSHAEYALTVAIGLLLLNASGVSFKADLEKIGGSTKIAALVLIPETEKIAAAIEKLTRADGGVSSIRRNGRLCSSTKIRMRFVPATDLFG